MSHYCTDNHTVINIYIHKRHIYNINIYTCQPFTYSYSFIFNFELNTFQFVSSLMISKYVCAHMRCLGFVTDIEVLFYFL